MKLRKVSLESSKSRQSPLKSRDKKDLNRDPLLSLNHRESERLRKRDDPLKYEEHNSDDDDYWSKNSKNYSSNNHDRNEKRKTRLKTQNNSSSKSSFVELNGLPGRTTRRRAHELGLSPQERSTSIPSVEISRNTRSKFFYEKQIASESHSSQKYELRNKTIEFEEDRSSDGYQRKANRITRSLRSGSRRTIQSEEEEEEEEDNDNDNDNDENEDEGDDTINESEQETEDQPKYSFRNREKTKREFFNVHNLGGDGGGCAKTSSLTYSRDLREQQNINGGRNYGGTQPRLYLGGKIPNYNLKSKPKRKNPNRDSYESSDRRHFDSSSESSSESSNKRKLRNHKFNHHGSNRRGGDDDTQFSKYEQQRLASERDSIQPINKTNSHDFGVGGSVLDKASKRDLLRADVTPLTIDPNIGFSSVGGLDKHINALKEMVLLPLLYPDMFARFNTEPPRGVLFLGPPGTGKTLTARALANSITAGQGYNGRKISFFMRKGADCLSKWVGEGERQLRLLFEQAKKMQPSIIFFDEIDGLAPVRSVKQDQIHASIVSTLLALMDGLDSRGQVVVIGATNRPDAIDAALRRPGRFDRELLFPLPNAVARSAILTIHTAKWNPPLPPSTHEWIVRNTVGYCGADIKAFCAEAALISLRRTYPLAYESNYRLKLDPSRLVLKTGDFAAALQKIVPCSQRSGTLFARPLREDLKPLLEISLSEIIHKIKILFPAIVSLIQDTSSSASTSSTGVETQLIIDESSEEWIASLTDAHECIPSSDEITTLNRSWSYTKPELTFQPRFVICGENNMGQEEIASALLHYLETLPMFNLDIPTLIGDIYSHSSEQSLVSKVQEAYRMSPSVIYIPNVNNWWSSATEGMKSLLFNLCNSFPSSVPVLWLSTVSKHDTNNDEKLHIEDESMVPDDNRLKSLIRWLGGAALQDNSSPSNDFNDLLYPNSSSISYLESPNASKRKQYFQDFVYSLYDLPQKIYSARMRIYQARMESYEFETEPAFADSIQKDHGIPGLSTILSSQTKDDISDETKQYKREIRTFFRAALSELMKEKRCHVFNRPVDPEIVPDYYDIIKCPMDLETMRMKVDEDCYPTLAHFLRDINQIVFNAKEYNPMTRADQRGRSIVHSAHGMIDMVESHAFHFKEELGYDLFCKCDQIAVNEGKPPPASPPVLTDNIPDINKKYYSQILKEHERLKQEAVLNSINKDEYNGEINRSNRDNTNPDDDDDDDDESKSESYTQYRSNKQNPKWNKKGSSHTSPVTKSNSFQNDSKSCRLKRSRENDSSLDIDGSSSVGSRSNRRRSGDSDELLQLDNGSFYDAMDLALKLSRSKSKKGKNKESIVEALAHEKADSTELTTEDGNKVQEDEMINDSFIIDLKNENRSTEIELDASNNNDSSKSLDTELRVIKPKLIESEILEYPIIVNLKISMDLARQAKETKELDYSLHQLVELTEGWNVLELSSLMTSKSKFISVIIRSSAPLSVGLNVIWRRFHSHGNWKLSLSEYMNLFRDITKSS